MFQRRKKHATAAAAALAMLSCSATAQDLSELLEPHDVQSLAHDLSIKMAGAAQCRIEDRMSMDDYNTVLRKLTEISEKKTADGMLTGALVVKGLELHPGNEDCRTVARQIDEAAPIYADLARMLTLQTHSRGALTNNH